MPIYFLPSGSLSTHDLTRRSTRLLGIFLFMHFNFQLTTSHGGRPSPRALSRAGDCLFQLTTSHGGRLSILDEHHHSGDPFNSRPHTEVDDLTSAILQSTWPFNSRPHTEVDRRNDGRQIQTRSFNSRPHTEVDATLSDAPRSA